MEGAKEIVVFAGANGSGKTTNAKRLLPELYGIEDFVNADIEAVAISPGSPASVALAAGRRVHERIYALATAGRSFGLETTLSGKVLARQLRELCERGYEVHLFVYWLQSPELAVARVAGRVASGGHGVPPQDVRRRFQRGLCNFFQLYNPLARTWRLFDNSGLSPVLVAQRLEGQRLTVFEEGLWARIQQEAARC